MKNKYRIVTDRLNGYCAQIKRWWLPFWDELPRYKGSMGNSFISLENAEDLIKLHKKGITPEDKYKQKVVKSL